MQVAQNNNRKDSGNMAREMAHAPDMEQPPHAPAGVSLSIAEQLKDAAILSSQESAALLSKALTDPDANPFKDLFGAVTFRLPDREGVYKDERRPTVTNRRMAFASFILGGLVEIDASIYAREETKRDETGAYLETTLSLSLPTANRQAIFKVPKGRPEIQLMIDAWRYQIVAAYEMWLSDLQAATPVSRADTSLLPRHVKRTAIQPSK